MNMFEIKRHRRFLVATFLATILSAGLLVLAAPPAAAEILLNLSVTKDDDPDPVVVGENLTYTIVVTNNDLALSAPNVTVTDELPAHTTFVSASSTQGDCAESGGTVTCNIGDLAASTAASSSATVTIVVKPAATAPSTISNTATVTADQLLDTNTADNSATEETTINRAPDAVDDAATTNEDEPVTVNVLGNDTDPDVGDNLSLASNSGANSGQVSCTGAGSCTYTPDADFNGTDSFQYTASDGRGGTDTATVTVTVDAVNDAPVNSVPGPQTTNEDTALVFSGVDKISVSDVDAGNNPVEVTLGVDNGTLTLSGIAGLDFSASAGDGANDASMTFAGTIAAINAALDGSRFDPAANYNGPAVLTITTNDQGHTGSGGAKSVTDTVDITVNAVNDAPEVAFTGGPTQVDESGTVEHAYTFEITDPDSSTFDFATGYPGCGAGGELVGAPQIGDRSFQCRFPDGPASPTVKVKVEDSGGASSNEASRQVQVNNVAPTATLNNDGPIDEGSSATVSFSDQDDASAADRTAGFRYEYRCDGSEFTSLPDYATADTGASKTCDFSGSGTKTVRAHIIDKDGGFTAYTTGVQVNNLPPTISNIADQTTNEDTPTGEIPFTVDDAGTPAADLRVTGGSSDTALVPNSNIVFGGTGANRTVKVTPAPDRSGTATITVRVSDGAATASDTFILTVTAVNDAPTVTLNGGANTSEGQTKTYNFTVTDLDSNGFAVKSGYPGCGVGGTFVAGSLATAATSGSFQCRFPDGPASSTVRVRVSDPQGADSNIATWSVTVANVAPTVTLSGPGKAKKSQIQLYKFAIKDPGNDAFGFAAGYPKCGEGGRLAGKNIGAGGGSFRCEFRSPARTAVALRVKDSDGALSKKATRKVTVADNGGGRCDIKGTKGNDNLRGTPGPDVICGLGGNDTIYGLGGHDVIYGGSGKDVLKGGNGRLRGGPRSDKLQGGQGRDKLYGGGGRDVLDTKDGAGGDLANGGPGADPCDTDPGDKKVSCR